MESSRSALIAATALILLFTGFDYTAEARVGVTTAVNQDAKKTAPGKGTKTIILGDEVVHNQVIDTDDAGLVQILLADGTAFTVGPNSTLTIDSFVYDPAAGTAKVSASLAKGFMRFIGGRTSKTAGGATIKTPIGTAGIRGAVVDIDLGAIGQRLGKVRSRKDRNTASGSNPPHVSLIFGNEVVLTTNGVSNRLFQAGYSIIIDGNRRTVTRTPPSFLAAMQAHLAGRPGTQGGAARSPQDTTVRGSGLAKHNSSTRLPTNIPIPEPRPGDTPQQTAASEARAAIVEQEISEKPGGTDNGETDNGGTSVPLRVLTARHDDDGGGNGIIGGSPGTDRRGTLNDKSGVVKLEGGSGLTLPVHADSAFTAHAVSGVSYGGATYAGNVYVGLDGFRAYMLTHGTNPLYAIAGKPTADVPGVFSTPGIRHYSLTPDAANPLTTSLGGVIPFVYAPGFAGVDLSKAASSDFMVSGTSGGSEPDVVARGLQAWIVIDGTGPTQKSGLGVMTGAVKLQEGTSYGFEGDRGGSSMLNPEDGMLRHRGQVVSIAGASDGSSIFGSGGNYLVLSNDPDDSYSYFRDRPVSGPVGDVRFSTGHVGNLVSTDTTLHQDYAGETRNGYSSIAMDMFTGFEARTGTVHMEFDAANATFDAAFTAPGNQEIGFTDDYGGAVYLDDNNFASSGSNNRSYVVNSKVAPVKIFNGGTSAELCTCSFLSWGWWGNTAGGEGPGVGHMGNWVIGDLTSPAELPMSGTATYAGNAVGTVLNNGNQYIATGTMNATMNFGARTGQVAIGNFDGRNFNTNVTFPSSTFSGTNGATSIAGSFANDGADKANGILGSFSSQDGSWSASGVFAGSR
ncbi:FecR domain-containing protein (plasmid) [Shinella sp. H4-D48]|uniref:FecR domain-containing protein n=1 Tax=Shinella sp. H4-D48 TaxID=2925841 RepID=UPI001F52F4D6|nr:FecR domain-containing protein [Shinella sp. H4-D48]UNK39987.1 FecR domain-containing protein [Shinella sp. H4-D48]